MKNQIIAAAAAVALFAAAPALAASAQTADFVKKAGIGNMFEIESSELALKRTSQKDVQEFAQMMVAQHAALGDDMKAALAASDTGLTAPEKLDPAHQKMLEGLKAAPTASFDQQYIAAQVKAHDEAVQVFGAYADDGDNAALKTFAAEALPAIKHHQDMVRDLQMPLVSVKQ